MTDDMVKNLKLGPANVKAPESPEEMKEKMEEIQSMLLSIEVVGSAGTDGLAVKVHLNGRYEATKVVIDPQLLAEKPTLVSELVASAITSASRKVEETIQSKMLEFFKK